MTPPLPPTRDWTGWAWRPTDDFDFGEYLEDHLMWEPSLELVYPNGRREVVGWRHQSSRPTEGQMATMATEAPVNGASTKQAMREVLDERATERSLGDSIRSLPRRTREYVSRVFDYLHLNRLTGTFSGAWERARPILSKIFGPIRTIGIFNLMGAALTCKRGRDFTRSAVTGTTRVLTWPLRMIGRGLGWVGRKIGLGGAVDEVEYRWLQASAWARNHFNDAMDWLDAHEHHGAMRWGRSVYQLNVGGRLIRRYAPVNLRTPLWIAMLFVPNLGVGSEGGAESKLSVVKDTIPSGEAKDLSEGTKSDPKPKAKEKTVTTETKETKANGETVQTAETTHELVERIHGTNVATGKKVKIRKVTKPDGNVIFTMNGRDYTETELNGVVEFMTENTPPPPMNRAARRATEQGKMPHIPGAEPASA